MKKLLVVLLSLGLIAAFAATASAAAPVVTFAGEYYLYGAYDSNISLNDNTKQSNAFFWTRTRMVPRFQVAEGLSMTVQIDALEKVWGRSTWRKGAGALSATPDDTTGSVRADGNGSTAAMQESVDIDRAFVDFNTAVGAVRVGYQGADMWGLDMGNTPSSRPRIQLVTPIGPVSLLMVYEKFYETYGTTQTAGGVNLAGKVDADADSYALAAIYKGKGIEGGFLYKYILAKMPSVIPAAGGPFTTKAHLVSPYVKATFGPVYVEAEVDYWFGKSTEYTNNSTLGAADVKIDALHFIVKGQFNMGPAYVGGLYAWASGNDPSDLTKNKQFQGQGLARGWDGPGLMLGNDSPGGQGLNYGTGTTQISSAKTNIWFAQVFGGYKVTPKLQLWSGLLYAQAVKKPGLGAAEFLSDKIGTEFDVTATYKLYDNLSYMVGAGYLWAGDWFKGANAGFSVSNDYLLVNKLTLSF